MYQYNGSPGERKPVEDSTDLKVYLVVQLECLIANANERIAELERRAAMIKNQRSSWQKELDDATRQA